MNKQFSNPSHVAKIGYNGFNMGHHLKFSSTVGELLPVYKDLLHPGDKVSMDTILKTRTMPLESAAFTRIYEHLEWFFVPITQIYSLFPSFYYAIQDVSSSIYTAKNVSQYFPFIPPLGMDDIFNDACRSADYYWSTDTSLTGTQYRLMELLGIPLPDFNFYGATSTVPGAFSFGKAINPMFACAYQKIYMDYYRDPDREVNDPLCYNLDKYYDNPTNGSQTWAPLQFFRLRYRRWAPDYFIHGYVSPLFGQTSMGASAYGTPTVTPNPDLTKSFNQWLLSGFTDIGGNYYGYNISTLNSKGAVDIVNPSTVSGDVYDAGSTASNNQLAGNTQRMLAASLSPSAIRTSFALQKLLEITRRAGKHFDAQQLAHFGVDVPQGISGEVTFIGKTTSELVIGDVIATAASDDNALGQVGGKGYNKAGSKTMKFTAPTHGILMCIYSAEPVADYKQKGLEYLNTLVTRDRWFTPEFDNLGMEPMFRFETEFSYVTPVGTSDPNDDILRWKFRYYYQKAKYNRTCGALMRSLDYWTTARDHVYNNLNDYLINPHFLDSIMVKNYEFDTDISDTDYGSLFDSDPLIHDLEFKVNKASKMSEYGLEQL